MSVNLHVCTVKCCFEESRLFLFLCLIFVNVGNSAPDWLDEADFRGSYRRMEMGP